MPDSTSTKKVVWFSRLLRWILGVVFITLGIRYFNDGGWPAILFGAVLFATGFLRPHRCIDGTCTLPGNSSSYKGNNT
ncbi:MAG TPA: DUF2892 domain-containing protein [Agriterribacter sp.]|mgnify:CR=1 FL=1|nr:DUF2892 domain-containing protein [Agriterribacter sp.]HRQ51155.1 DUF2892 domain-containing protein [Agriterribacter sp.]